MDMHGAEYRSNNREGLEDHGDGMIEFSCSTLMVREVFGVRQSADRSNGTCPDNQMKFYCLNPVSK
jgi:hypothetical protein